MNKQSKSLGKRSTNTASLSNAIADLKSQINPCITVGSARSHPKSKRTSAETWARRSVRVFLQQSTSSAITLTYGKVFSSAGVVGSIDARMRVLEVRAWNFTQAGNNTNYLKFTSAVGVLETGAITVVEDIGTANSLAAVFLRFPRTHSDDRLISKDSTVEIGSVSAFPVTYATLQPQTICFDVLVEYKFSNNE